MREIRFPIQDQDFSPARMYSWLSDAGRDAVARDVANGSSPREAVFEAFSFGLLEFIGSQIACATVFTLYDEPHFRRGVLRQLDRARRGVRV